MAQAEYLITEMFEEAVSRYTGAPYAIAVDNCSNALFLCMMYEEIRGLEIHIPSHTFMSVPCEIIHAGGRVKFDSKYFKGVYQLKPTNIWDCALRFTYNMYQPGQFMCLSFSGPYKHLKLGKGGIILTDNKSAYEWFKKARMCGRNEVAYEKDNFTMLGWNFYMLPELAAKGLQLMRGFYKDGIPLDIPDVEVSYPDLSQFEIYSQ